ncbi:MAG: glucose-6-phosphate isomerase family protein [Candidatus Micrarchaeales archaeon]|jgi:glucose-6-phosphate isomerase
MEYKIAGMRFVLNDYVLSVDGKIVERTPRIASELRDVLYSKDWLKGNENMPLYYMYRNAAVLKELSNNKIRYDITVLRPVMLGEEFNKTLGHYHKIAEKGLSYPELYEVLDGDALYLLQKPLKAKTEVVLISAKKGDKVLIPPNYGHITINVGRSDLVMANLVSSEFESDYKPIIEKKGGAVYVLRNKEIVFNNNYGNIKLEIRDGPEEYSIDLEGDILHSFIEEPEKFRFLNKPSLRWAIQ